MVQMWYKNRKGTEEEKELEEETENRKKIGRLKRMKADRWNFEGGLKCVGEELEREVAV